VDGVVVTEVLAYDLLDGDPTICQVVVTAGASVSMHTVNIRHGMGALVADVKETSTQDASRLVRAQEIVDAQIAEAEK